MTKRPLLLRPLMALTEEEETAEIAAIVRIIEAARDGAAAEQQVPNEGGRKADG